MRLDSRSIAGKRLFQQLMPVFAPAQVLDTLLSKSIRSKHCGTKDSSTVCQKRIRHANAFAESICLLRECSGTVLKNTDNPATCQLPEIMQGCRHWQPFRTGRVIRWQSHSKESQEGFHASVQWEVILHLERGQETFRAKKLMLSSKRHSWGSMRVWGVWPYMQRRYE